MTILWMSSLVQVRQETLCSKRGTWVLNRGVKVNTLFLVQQGNQTNVEHNIFGNTFIQKYVKIKHSNTGINNKK